MAFPKTRDSSPADSLPYPARQFRTRRLAVAALVAALLAATGWIALPIGAVPVTLQVFVVVLAALLLPAQWAAAALGAYLLLGAAGLPVFASGRAGLGVVFGPTGGYLFGFLAGAALGALSRRTLERRAVSQAAADIAAVVVVVVAVYVIGWMQLALVAHLSPVEAFLGGVAPFVVPDAIKAAAAIVVARGVRLAGVRL